MLHAPASEPVRLIWGVSRRVGWCAWLIACGIGCSGCYQSTIVPPTTSITPPPIYTAPGIPPLSEPYSPPSSQPIDPITANNPWKPDSELREWNYLVLHHTASDSGSVESIHQEHLTRKDKNGNSWLGIGYHFVIGNGQGMDDGVIEPTFRWKQQLQGAHAGVADYNQHGIGIVLIGNFENAPPTEAQTTSVKRLVGVLKREYGILSSKIVGHADVKATECPGKYFPLSEIRDHLAWDEPRVSVSFAPLSDVHGQPDPKVIILTNSNGDSRK